MPFVSHTIELLLFEMTHFTSHKADMHIQKSPYKIVGLVRIQAVTDAAGALILQTTEKGLLCFMKIGQRIVMRQWFCVPALVTYHAAVHVTIAGVRHLHDSGMATDAREASVSGSRKP